MVTWPITAEQFINEKFITEVLRIGVQVGSKEWGYHDKEDRLVIRREKVADAVLRLMAGGDAAAEMKRRAREYATLAKTAVEGGSSYTDVEALIEELRVRQNMFN
ncbi:hypothetical protein Nepgr_018145 [Nepenthes gracilis]|uniref:Uncharacterized protein n=1 Tax=Nepenthes gracilis TaxID=150966 RepID=A0AAD3XTR8_NEPGR|nr:hypothetical protein Nepgr_018145 [Nepenthes gracilis]